VYPPVATGPCRGLLTGMLNGSLTRAGGEARCGLVFMAWLGSPFAGSDELCSRSRRTHRSPDAGQVGNNAALAGVVSEDAQTLASARVAVEDAIGAHRNVSDVGHY
jgi:hypothetical protein